MNGKQHLDTGVLATGGVGVPAPRGRRTEAPEYRANLPRTAPPSGTVRWVAATWDDPDALVLRQRMDAELRPRYAPFDAQRAGRRPGPPTAAEIAVTWLAYEGAAPLATASLRLLRHRDAEDLYEVKRVYVHDEHRGRGLAVAALDSVENSARALGVSRLSLQTGKLQPEAMGLYERQGWHRIPCYPPYDADSFGVCYGKRR
ncbi:GNAT family N-acetyltransferase [Streptomyces glycanivorans]|uniref:GNAT family N-acetyltransferase n=1 Tax=Streptomyces glycanivorans TaxID=3033808 RepID=A0ABY9J3D4_9ACTN|nr:GNAT family N-acetyltransferase [Streptomyces sp. Alt3]WLQ62347.1 GNAT family N-acetyltransferase [Streptomyces sp. Alt3]